MKNTFKTPLAVCIATAGLAAMSAQAATWSDTYIGFRTGSKFHEPNNVNDVKKNIYQFTHSSGYAKGQNFLNIDLLQSDDMDPARGSAKGAQEVYVTYRHQFHLGKLTGKDMSWGPVKEVAITAGFDINSKNTAFAPNKNLIVVGPTLKMNVPGFWDISLLAGKERNHCGLGAPACPNPDVSFKQQLILSTTWGIPFSAGGVPMKFQGFLNYMPEKGNDYANVPTKAETLMRTSLMFDVGQMVAGKKDTVYMGIGYEYWKNKFGNYANGAGVVKAGINTHAPTFQMEWHF